MGLNRKACSEEGFDGQGTLDKAPSISVRLVAGAEELGDAATIRLAISLSLAPLILSGCATGARR